MINRLPLAGLALAIASTFFLGACEYLSADGWLRQPFEGPSFTMDEGLTGDWEADHTFVISTTYLPVRPTAEAQELFDERMIPIRELLDDGPEGLIGYSVAQRLIGSEYRTLTVWESYDALYAFVLSDAHLAAVNDASDIAVEGEARVFTWEAKQDELPPKWGDAEARLEEAGRKAVY